MQFKFFVRLTFAFVFVSMLCVGCSAQTEEQALAELREITRGGKLPADARVAAIEARFSGRPAGALAKLLRARIRFENKDLAGAAALLKGDDLLTKTKLGDHALWLRGRALQGTGEHAEAMRAFERVWREFPDSIRADDARLRWAESAIASGNADKAAAALDEMNARREPKALLLAAKAYEALGRAEDAFKNYRLAYFFGAGTDAAREAEAALIRSQQPLTAQNAEEARSRAERLLAAKNYAEAEKAYSDLAAQYPLELTPQVRLDRLRVLSNLKKAAESRAAFDSIPVTAEQKERAYYELAMAYARARLWPQARQVLEEMRQKYSGGALAVKAWVDTGMAARDAKNKGEESFFLRTALTTWPEAVEVAGAQFELAWLQHEAGNFDVSSRMLIEHLARYTDRDTTYRGRSGYWAARDSERAGKLAEACALYEALIYRYSANWYGHLGQQRLAALRQQKRCPDAASLPAGSMAARAAENLKKVTVAPETSTQREWARAEKSDELSLVGLFDWAIEELEEARRSAENSPRINLALARHYRMKGSNVNALLALARSYPDYSQMFPEEMGREEWDIFYPLTNWNDIREWSKKRGLDPFQVAGLIRQESVFDPRARSHADAYGLMQLLIPTARAVARKYGSDATVSVESLFQPAINIELGTAYMRDQMDRFGRIEYMAVAYNAGPGRVPQWRASLPLDMDEFVEAIPFRETRGYVQGIIRNTAQYRRLYDEDGNFRPNVGTSPLRAEVTGSSR